MNVVHCPATLADTAPGPTIFLAGPATPAGEAPWRAHAGTLLSEIGFSGTVFNPEPPLGQIPPDVAGQAAWDYESCLRADVIAFWIPRRLPQTKGLTSNIEFGLWAHSQKVVFGAPEWAEEMDYLRALAARLVIPSVLTLAELMRLAARQAALT